MPDDKPKQDDSFIKWLIPVNNQCCASAFLLNGYSHNFFWAVQSKWKGVT